jgi:hypothetical protein
MAANPTPFLRELDNMLRSNAPPRAILLSAGGNDVVKKTLTPLLQKGDPANPVNHKAMDAKIGGELRDHYATILTKINDLCGGSVPVLVHPYCHPIPDGRLIFNIPRNPYSWLYPSISMDMEYDEFKVGVPIMTQVIDKFEAMQQTLTRDFRNVIVVPSVKILDPFWPGRYKDVWENELHPNARGFSLVGKIFADTIAALP